MLLLTLMCDVKTRPTRLRFYTLRRVPSRYIHVGICMGATERNATHEKHIRVGQGVDFEQIFTRCSWCCRLLGTPDHRGPIAVFL